MLKDLQHDFENASKLDNEIVSLFEDGDSDLDDYLNDNVYNRLQLLYFKHAAKLQESLKVVSVPENNLNTTQAEFSNSTFSRFGINNGIFFK